MEKKKRRYFPDKFKRQAAARVDADRTHLVRLILLRAPRPHASPPSSV